MASYQQENVTVDSEFQIAIWSTIPLKWEKHGYVRIVWFWFILWYKHKQNYTREKMHPYVPPNMADADGKLCMSRLI